MNTKKEPFKIRLKKLHLKNFKAFDDIEIEFPEPLMKNDPDVFIMGSKNGLGKTSVLEAISLLLILMKKNSEGFKFIFSKVDEFPIDLKSYFIKAGQQEAKIEGFFEINENKETFSISIYTGDKDEFLEFIDEDNNFENNVIFACKSFNSKLTNRRSLNTKQFKNNLISLLSFDSEPLILSTFMYFHSNRKVKEGFLELTNLLNEDYKEQKSRKTNNIDVLPSSRFKLEILNALMSRVGLFENIENMDYEQILLKLNSLTKTYANGTIEKLRSISDSKIELRIKPLENGPSFAFDALSSGQKEIISTLFLIWKYTQKQPGIILIDEPELHLNAEWQMKFIHTLNKLAPQNQYIFATHSENVFSSVEPEYRILLKPDTFKEVATND